MRRAKIRISRFNPDIDKTPYWQEYQVPWEKGDTVLGALIYIYEELDPTLAFRFGCRYKKCGLCAVEVEGRPRLACLAGLKKEMEVSPLRNLPIARDLAIDRGFFYHRLAELKLYIPEQESMKWPAVIKEGIQHKRLIGCVECLSCLSACPHYDYRDTTFGGPYLFVKLAQLHFDSRDKIDRRFQARTLGIERCKGCRYWGRCVPCTSGIPIFKDAIRPLS
ncbi:MAG: hypothetical protein HY998_02000 [candidate division NC10 bacterium]|nr:hypothetical protein [candidate division NC10 bacterium]